MDNGTQVLIFLGGLAVWCLVVYLVTRAWLKHRERKNKELLDQTFASHGGFDGFMDMLHKEDEAQNQACEDDEELMLVELAAQSEGPVEMRWDPDKDCWRILFKDGATYTGKTKTEVLLKASGGKQAS